MANKKQMKTVKLSTETVTAGASSDILGILKRVVNTICGGLDKYINDMGKDVKQKTIKEGGRSGNQVVIMLNDGSKLSVKSFPHEDDKKIDIIIQLEGKKAKSHKDVASEKEVNRLVEDYLKEVGWNPEADEEDDEDIIDVEAVDSAQKLQVTLQKVTSGSSVDIHLSAIYANYNIEDAMNVLDDVLDNVDFVDTLTDTPTSYEIVEIPGENEYDVNQITSVEVNSCYHQIFKAAVVLLHDAQCIYWGAKGQGMDELRRQIESKMWDFRYYVDVLAELIVEKTGDVPHISNYCCKEDALDAPGGLTFEYGIITMQNSLHGFISTLESYYVNLDHDIQTMVDNWLRDCKKHADFYMERKIVDIAPVAAL